MPVFDEAEIERLIRCEKFVTDPPKRAPRIVGAYSRNDMKLSSKDGNSEFLVFMRKNEDFPENFSIGLMYVSKDGNPDKTLLRCNGQHGVYDSSIAFDANSPHWDYHIHRATERALNEGFRPEKYAVATTEFASYDQAVTYFLATVNLGSVDISKYFAPKNKFTPHQDQYKMDLE